MERGCRMIDRHVGEAVQSASANHNARDAGNEPGFRDILAVGSSRRPEPGQMAEARKTRILCIEDDRETAALIAEELIERGYEVTVAGDGREGFAAILKDMPDLVLSDISMPVMSGFEVLERLTALAPRFRNMPFVFLTALSDRDNELRGRQLGADDYVTKPIDFDLLATIITARLAGVARMELWPRLVDLNDREVEAL